MSENIGIENEYFPSSVSIPGETLIEVLDERGISQTEFAARTGRPKKTINEIIKGKAAISRETALKFEKVLGITASFWNNLENNYREYVARLEERNRLSEYREWFRRIPVKQMIEKNWLKKCSDKIAQIAEVLSFFGVASPKEWEDVCMTPQAQFRKPAKFDADPGAISAWLRRGELEGASLTCKPYNKDTLKSALEKIRKLTNEEPEIFVSEMRNLCAQAGVAVVFVPEIPKSRASGATRWLTQEKALVQLSLRYKTNDHLWFTFFHEAGHIILHGKKEVFLECSGATSELENEADKFAADLLIPPVAYRKFTRRMTRRIFSKKNICDFADSIGIAPGIVAGRLQHDNLLPHKNCNELKQKLQWSP